MERPAAIVDALLTEYLQEQDGGRQPRAEEYLERLPSDEDRREFRERLRCLEWAVPVMPATVLANTVLADRYELVEELGAGGFGKVWRARDRQLEREVAVKVLNVMSHAHADLRRCHRSEWMALSRLQHPGTVRVYAAAEHQHALYIVTDLVQGRSLEKVLDELRERGEPPDQEALQKAVGRPCPAGVSDLIGGSYPLTVARILVEILRTLEAAHAAEVLHRDIKPPNVMLTGGAWPVLLDFGMASLTDESSGVLTGRLIGTTNYLAPEQIRAHAIGRSVLTDVYQVGLVLYEMLTLRPAFSPEEGVSTIPDRILHGEYSRPREIVPDMAEELEAICLRALQHTPERRFASATAFREALEQWLAVGTIPAGVAPEPPAENPTPANAEHRYEVRKEVYRNDFEVVQLAWDRVLGCEVVLKRAGPGLWSPHVRQRIVREGRRLAQVNHPGIVRLYDVTTMGPDLVLVMAPLRGMPLTERLASGLPSVAETLRWGQALAEALHALHEVGVVHCCLGPETVWIDKERTPTVTGFMFAREVDGSTVSTVGFDRLRPEAPARAYLAPEQQAGTRPDARTDVFALGCLLHRCMTGSDPDFAGSKIPNARAARREVSRRLSAVLQKCMHPARTRRYTSMLQVAEALASCA